VRLEALDWQASLKNTVCGCEVSELVKYLPLVKSNVLN